MFSVVDVWEQSSGMDCPFVWKPEIHKGDKADYVDKLNKQYNKSDLDWCDDEPEKVTHNVTWKMYCVTFSTLEEAIKFVDPVGTGYYYNFTEGGE